MYACTRRCNEHAGFDPYGFQHSASEALCSMYCVNWVMKAVASPKRSKRRAEQVLRSVPLSLSVVHTQM